MRPLSYIGYLDNARGDPETYMGRMLADCVSGAHMDGAFYICHNPEEDDKKVHYHVLFVGECAKKVYAASWIQKVAGSALTLPRQSKLTDWLLYAIHDKTYLDNKGITKKWHYDRADVKCTDENLLLAAWASVGEDPAMCDVRNRIKLGIQQGSGITDAVIRANPRPNEVHGCMEYAKLYSTMYYDEINRQIAYYQKILDMRKEEMNNDTQQQQLNDEYFHGIQLQLEDLYLQSRKGRGHQ